MSPRSTWSLNGLTPSSLLLVSMLLFVVISVAPLGNAKPMQSSPTSGSTNKSNLAHKSTFAFNFTVTPESFSHMNLIMTIILFAIIGSIMLCVMITVCRAEWHRDNSGHLVRSPHEDKTITSKKTSVKVDKKKPKNKCAGAKVSSNSDSSLAADFVKCSKPSPSAAKAKSSVAGKSSTGGKNIGNNAASSTGAKAKVSGKMASSKGGKSKA